MNNPTLDTLNGERDFLVDQIQRLTPDAMEIKQKLITEYEKYVQSPLAVHKIGWGYNLENPRDLLNKISQLGEGIMFVRGIIANYRVQCQSINEAKHKLKNAIKILETKYHQDPTILLIKTKTDRVSKVQSILLPLEQAFNEYETSANTVYSYFNTLLNEVEAFEKAESTIRLIHNISTKLQEGA